MILMERPFICVLLLGLISSARPVSAENWNAWRGLRGDGTSLEKNVPTRWNGATGENILWKVQIPGEGHASPVVWGDRLFLLSCLKETNERVLLCLDRDTGATLWQRTVLEAPLESKHALNSFASSTPATDGKSIFVLCLEVTGATVPAPNVSTPRLITPARVVVASYDLEGREQWRVKPGRFLSAHGFASSPILYKDLVIINGDHDGDGYIVALERRTGEVRWRIDRPNNTRSYVTPIIRDLGGRTQMVLSGSECVTSYDPDTGRQHWIVDGPTEQFVASMVSDGKFVFLTAGYPEHHILAIRPDGSGNVTDSHIVWRTKRGAGYVPSPVIQGKYLLVVSDGGIASCFDAASGDRQWMNRLGGRHSASLVAAGGLAYFLSDKGVMTVVRPGPTYEVVAENALGEHCIASPAISGGRLYIRGEKNLYCVDDRGDP